MNESGTQEHTIDRDAAADLMEPLTELVIRAGDAILAINRGTLKIEGKADSVRGKA